ncbi:MAG: thioredoxin fold domain-containing protein [Saprospiraceae bacterium]
MIVLLRIEDRYRLMITIRIKPVCISFFCFWAVLGNTQNLAAPKIRWMSFEQVTQDQNERKTPKKIMVDLFTDNCGWCRKMDISTFQNEFISHYLNENFYPVRFNAQYKKDIKFNNETFKLDPSGFHELAITLSLGDLGFPTLVFLDEENQIIQPIQGYQTVDDLEKIMFYFANDLYKSTPWNDFVEHFKPTNSKPRIDPMMQMEKSNIEMIKKKN